MRPPIAAWRYRARFRSNCSTTRKPTAILYWISPTAYWVQKRFRHTRYITLVNLLTAKQVFSRDLSPYDPASPADANVLFPEYLTCENKSRALADHVIRWLTDRAEHARVTAELAALKARVGHGGASRRASQYILAVLGAKRQARLGPISCPPAELRSPRRVTTRNMPPEPIIGAFTPSV